LKVFLTGASSGIGEALARHYAGEGAILGLFARRADKLRELKLSLPTPSETYTGDVRDLAAVAVAAEDFISRHGVPDIVIGNAGVSFGTLTENAVDAAVFRETLDINVLGLVHTFQPFVAGMMAARHGTLVGIASVAGFRGLPGAGAYSGSKAAAIAYLESLRIELRGSGLAVVTICPGFIDTPLTAKNPYRMPFLMQPEDAARGMVAAIARHARFYVVPWQMAWAGRLLKLLPRPLYDRVFANRPHKPRQVD